MTDDIVDNKNNAVDKKKLELLNWKRELELAFSGKTDKKLLKELSNSVNLFNIPKQPFYDLIDGVELDLVQNRFSNFDELKNYCYKVASTVGLMTIPIFGYKNKDTVDYAINLGLALQLTNIIRDVKVDGKNDRIYLPLEDLERFEYTEKELLDNVYNENFIELMKFQTERARKFYDVANDKLPDEDRSTMFAARSMQYIYYRLLDKIEQNNFNVFEHKIRVSTFNKLFISTSVWLKYKLFK
jgi:phytoene synthase